ncbi:MAG: 4Fe-4S binding protein [Candidatus Nealsonbacteria bacterium]|nr:4Fe-4S binding protein [Candidatus Nealsonbacteria bacterium]
MRKAMFKFGKDEKKCSGCRICEMACVLYNKKECNPKKAFIKISGNFPEPGGYNIKILKGCTLCGECTRICPIGALFEKKNPEEQK